MIKSIVNLDHKSLKLISEERLNSPKICFIRKLEFKI